MARLDLANYQNRHSLGSKVARAFWNLAWGILFRPTPCFGLFNAWRILLLRLFGAKIGRHCVVKPSVRVWQPWKLRIGNYVALSEEVNCYSVDQITIGDSTTISRESFLCCAGHDVSSQTMELTYAPITIGAQCWLGARSFVMPGVTIGDGAVVGACSLVVRDVEPWTIVGGNPASMIKKRELCHD